MEPPKLITISDDIKNKYRAKKHTINIENNDGDNTTNDIDDDDDDGIPAPPGELSQTQSTNLAPMEFSSQSQDTYLSLF